MCCVLHRGHSGDGCDFELGKGVTSEAGKRVCI